MNLRNELISAQGGDDFLLMSTPYSFAHVDQLYADCVRGEILGRPSDYKDPPRWYRIRDRSGNDLDICFRRGSKLGIAARQPVYQLRKYEYQYTFAGYLARFIARQMKRTNKPLIHFRINKDNYYHQWFGGSGPEDRCFWREFKSSWTNEMMGCEPWEATDADRERRCKLHICVAHSDRRISFLNTENLPREVTWSVIDLLDAVADVEKIDALIQTQEKL
jgi:hypothetical protein